MNLETLIVPLHLDKTNFEAGLASVTNLAKTSLVGIGALAGAAAAGMTLAVNATFQWAAELDALGDVIDGTNTEIAALAYVAKKAGVPVESVAKANVMLEKSLVKSNGELDTSGKALKEYGIDVKDANGNVKTSIQLTDEIAKRYASLNTQQERVNFLTAIYGKNGTQMIDVLDTLNKEGGIAAVTKKVEALGLAIDPSRYEQFSRSLEELKLIGLSLAVAFTEQIMPIFERLMDWVMNVGIPGFMKFKDAILLAFQQGGLSGALKELDSQIANFIDTLPVEEWGASFGNAIERLLTIGIGGVDVFKSFHALDMAITDFFIAAIGPENIRAFKEHFIDYIILQLNILEQQGTAAVRRLVINSANALMDWGHQTGLQMVDATNQLAIIIDTKLREITKNFFNRALSWGQQMVKGLDSAKGTILKYVSDLVEQINGILKKIINPWSALKNPGNISIPTGGSNKPQNPMIVPKGAKATGGPVFAGQTYRVNERNHEYFTPAVNGVVSPQPTMVSVDIDYNRMARAFAYELAKVTN